MAYYKFKLLGIITCLLASTLPANAQQEEACINHETLVKKTFAEAKDKGKDAPLFRIARKDDGQSLVYWHYGGTTGSFHAVTFKTDGCAVLLSSGEIRRFIFPKTAYNTGVFFEMDVLETDF